MATTQYEDIFSKDTPPSDFDDFDLKTLLACSPALPVMNCLTPESFTSRSFSSSNSSESTTSDMAWREGELASSLYYPQATVPFQEPVSYDAGESSFPLYQQQDWMSLQSYPPLPSLESFTDAPPTSIFPAFDVPSSSGGTIIPPRPQSITESSFSFDTLTQQALQSQSYIIPSPALSQARSTLSRGNQSLSHAESVSSSSRSCSPDSSIFQPGDRVVSGLSKSTSSSSNSAHSLRAYGIPVNTPGVKAGTEPQTWRCAYPGCTSRAVFTRGCDLRKHFNRHSKHLFCRVDGCPQSAPRDIADGKRGSISATGGFSSKKDRARHEAKHNPTIRCEWRGQDGEECGRVFSRMDNMKDHVRRIHKKSGR